MNGIKTPCGVVFISCEEYQERITMQQNYNQVTSGSVPKTKAQYQKLNLLLTILIVLVGFFDMFLVFVIMTRNTEVTGQTINPPCGVTP